MTVVCLCQLLVWSLVAAVSRRHLPGLEQTLRLWDFTTRYSWTDHSLPVTELLLGHWAARLVSARNVYSTIIMTFY